MVSKTSLSRGAESAGIDRGRGVLEFRLLAPLRGRHRGSAARFARGWFLGASRALRVFGTIVVGTRRRIPTVFAMGMGRADHLLLARSAAVSQSRMHVLPSVASVFPSGEKAIAPRNDP